MRQARKKKKVRSSRGRLGTLANVPSGVHIEPEGAGTTMPCNLKIQAVDRQ